MKYIYFGTPDRAVTVLDKLIETGFTPLAVVTSPDKPVGRRQILTQSAISKYAESKQINTYKPSDKRELLQISSKLASYKPDFIIVVAYGYLIPDEILEIPTYDSLNVHYSLLPKWRGASPVVSQILHNEEIVGFTIIKLVSKLDAGPVYYSEAFSMPTPLPTTDQLAHTMSVRGAQVLPEITTKIMKGDLKPLPQDESLATYCSKNTKDDGLVDIFNDSDYLIFQKTQAYTPWPKTFFFVEKNKISQ